MKRRITVLLAVMLFAGLAEKSIIAAGKPTIYIKQLVPAKTVKKDDAARFTKLLIETLVKTGRYDVMSDDVINQELDNAEKRQLLGCNSEECIARIMSIMQTEYIIYGEMEKDGKGYIVSVDLIQRIKGGNSTLKGSSNTQLIDLDFNSMKSHADLIIRDLHGEGSSIVKPETEKEKKIGNMEFVSIPGGTYMMGSPESEKDRRSDEKQHKVTVSSFWMGKYEVTQKQYEEIMGTNPSYFKGANLPVEQVSWNEAMEFCKKFSKKYNVKARLPYEAEWEYAARAGTTTAYYWGDAVDGNYLWYGDNSGSKTHRVGEKKPNRFGLYDMSGNVWEWCMDWNDEGYYAKSPQDNPEGPSSGNYRVLRGGSWYVDSDNRLRSAFRLWYSPGRRTYYSGFRVVVGR